MGIWRSMKVMKSDVDYVKGQLIINDIAQDFGGSDPNHQFNRPSG